MKKEKSFSDIKNEQPAVKIEEAQVREERPDNDLPETRAMIQVKSFSMPLANVDQIKTASKRYQEFLNALISEKDVVRMKDKKSGEERLIGKKTAFGKIARFWGISTEIIRSFTETEECKKDVCVWGYANGRSFPKIKLGDTYLIAKSWAKAILPSGQFATRGAAVSESERSFAHIPHDLLATAETRAVKRAVEAVIGMGEIELQDEETEQKPKTEPVPEEKPKETSVKEISAAQGKFISEALLKLGYTEDKMIDLEFNLGGIIKILPDCDFDDATVIIKAIKKGKEDFEKLIEKKNEEK